MSERNLYGNGGEFVGSVDDDGRIYDNRHSFMGRIENGIIYDNCNIPQGRITDSGMVLDNHRQEVGQEYGTGFCSPGPRREMGTVRADILSEGHGSDYGAFHLLDRNQRHRYDTYPYDEDDDDYDDDGESDDWNDGDASHPSVPSYRHSSHGGHQNFEFSGFGCLVVALVLGGQFLFFLIMYQYVMR